MDENKEFENINDLNIENSEELEIIDPEDNEVIEEEEEKKKHPKLTKTIIIIILLFTILIGYTTLIEPKIITIKESKIASDKLPTSFDGLKIVHFSDLHYGGTITKKELNKIAKKINELKPDIIFFTGDLIDKNININDEGKQELIDFLTSLNPSLYKYASLGDEDYLEDYENILVSANFKLLKDESTLLYYKDLTPIMITGINPQNEEFSFNFVKSSEETLEKNNLYHIILSHDLSSLENLLEENPNLILSGHTLGGIIKIPFIGPLFLDEKSKEYYEDYYKINDTDIYISNGLGTSNIKMRFNNLPSINFYRLSKNS